MKRFITRNSYIPVMLENYGEVLLYSEDRKIHQILFCQYEFCNKFAKFSRHQSFLPYGTLFCKLEHHNKAQ